MVKYIFGITPFASMIKSYIPKDQWGGFIVDRANMVVENQNNEIIFWDEFVSSVDPSSCEIILAIGYTNMNEGRKLVFERIKKAGFRLCNYIHPSCTISDTVCLGEGNVFLENCVIQPFVNIGNANIFWSNVNVCHHTDIGNFNFLAASSVVLGRVLVGNQCFIGANSTIKNRVTVSDKTLVGANCFLHTSTEPEEVFVPVRSIKLDKKSSEIKI